MPSAGFRRFAWGVLACNMLVVLWGAFVRATGSGAGCGGHWPLCNGEVLPRAPRIETLIEYTHRLSSGLALLSVAALAVWALRRLARGHPARRNATLALALVLVEAALGAGLVLFNLVGADASVARVVYLAAHLFNTLLLLAALTLTAWHAAEPKPFPRGRGPVVAALAAVMLVSITGVVAALGDTLFPSASLASGVRQDFSPAAHFLIRLRSLHPVAALAAAIYIAALGTRTVRAPGTRSLGLAIMGLAFAQVLAGALNIALLAPVWMQIIHLLLADLLWIVLVTLWATCAAWPTERSW